MKEVQSFRMEKKVIDKLKLIALAQGRTKVSLVIEWINREYRDLEERGELDEVLNIRKGDSNE